MIMSLKGGAWHTFDNMLTHKDKGWTVTKLRALFYRWVAIKNWGYLEASMTHQGQVTFGRAGAGTQLTDKMISLIRDWPWPTPQSDTWVCSAGFVGKTVSCLCCKWQLKHTYVRDLYAGRWESRLDKLCVSISTVKWEYLCFWIDTFGQITKYLHSLYFVPKT